MQKDMDKLVLETRFEVADLQSALASAIKAGVLNEDEKKAAERASELLESMYYSW